MPIFRDLDSRFSWVGSSSLQIKNIQESDAGTYLCRAENREDSVDAPASVQVQVGIKKRIRNSMNQQNLN